MNVSGVCEDTLRESHERIEGWRQSKTGEGDAAAGA